MSIMDKNNYSNCPLKKRPIYVIEEEEEEGEADDVQINAEILKINDTAPVDLSNKNRIQTIERRFSNAETPVNFSKVQLPPIREDVREGQYEYKISKSLDWYERELQNKDFPEQLTSKVYERKPFRVASFATQENLRRADSVSPPVFTATLPNHRNRDLFKNPYRTINNNIVQVNIPVPNFPSPDHHSHYQDRYHHVSEQSDYLMLSPSSSSVLSYGSNQSGPVDYFEPEDLSVKNKKKVLMPTDSSVNIQKHSRKDYNEVIGGNDMYYQCRNCNKCYSTYGGLVKHQQSHHPQNQMRSLPNDLEYSAIPPAPGPLQDLRVKEKLKTENSKTVNSPRYQCKDCRKSYSTYSGLTKHQQFHCPAAEKNQVKKLFSCKNCEKVYVSLGALKMHIRTHTLPCKCPLCGKAFSRPWLLQGHIRTHTGEKPFTCQHCHRAFADRSNLRAHLQTHSEVKKYSCSSCTKTFSRMSLLGKHVQGGCPGMTSNYHHQSHEQNGSSDSIQYQESKEIVDSTTDRDLHHHQHHHYQHRTVYEENSKDRYPYSIRDTLYKDDVGVY